MAFISSFFWKCFINIQEVLRNNTTLTFTTRQNVKWSDGQSFSADDVAFTFTAMKQYASSGADIQGVWNYLSSVTATDANTVVMKFQKAYPPELWTIASQVYIIFKHIFASVGDITKYSTDKPSGGLFPLASVLPWLALASRSSTSTSR